MEENQYNKSEKSILQDMNEEEFEALRQLNNQFEAMDGKKKARMILAAAIAILILGLYFLYRFFSFFF